MKLDPPILSRGGLSGRIYVITHGKVEPHPNEPGKTMVIASKKYDVSEQYDALLGEIRDTLATALDGLADDIDLNLIERAYTLAGGK